MADLLPPFFAAFFCRAWNSLSLASNSLLSPLRIMPKKPDQLPASIHLRKGCAAKSTEKQASMYPKASAEKYDMMSPNSRHKHDMSGPP